MNWKRIANSPVWAWNEIVWYIKWWGHKYYSFGEWLLGTGVKLIDLYDCLLDEIIENAKEVHRRGLD